MTCIENIFICMASPLLVAALCMGRRRLRFFLFGVAGMGVCLLSAYINTFLAAVYQADALAATVEIAPVVEEVMKLLPLLFYLLIFEPKTEQIKISAVITALSFATFENICYLIQNGAGHFSFIFFRGIGTGAMHVICGAIVGGGLAYVWQRTWLKIAGTCGLLGAAITLHAIYNLLIAQPKVHREAYELNKQPVRWINFKNGYYDPVTGEMLEHNPDYLTINQIPFPYYPEDCEQVLQGGENIKKYLASSLPNKEEQQTFWEYFGYCMKINDSMRLECMESC